MRKALPMPALPLYPDRNIPLGIQGRQQAGILAAQLPPPRQVYCSEMQRTAETAAPYCRLYGITPAVLPELNEFSYLPFAQVAGLDGTQRRTLAEAYWARADADETGAVCI